MLRLVFGLLLESAVFTLVFLVLTYGVCRCAGIATMRWRVWLRAFPMVWLIAVAVDYWGTSVAGGAFIGLFSFLQFYFGATVVLCVVFRAGSWVGLLTKDE